VSPPSAPIEIGAEAQEEPQLPGLLRLFLPQQPAHLVMKPEIRAILFGLLIAALACPAILALFYNP
jgi:hypothetical protein